MASYQRWNQGKDSKKKFHMLAAELRQRATKSEELLWEALRNRKLDGKKFRRQVPVGAFVLDFYCAEEKLAIEIDGKVHEAQRDADLLRQTTLESLNIRFLRFSADQIEQSLDAVLEQIRETLS
jgi:adenine-specific DNA-methyltransferase